MSVMADTSHDPIGPFGPAEQLPTGDSLMHAPKASWSCFLFWGANTAVTATTKAFGVGALTAMIHTRAGTKVVHCMSPVSCKGHLPRQEVVDRMKRTENENDNESIPAICALQTHQII